VESLRQRVGVLAAIDISDGLSLDRVRLCAASGVGAELDVENIPIHSDARIMAAESGRTPFQHAWSDGEDFELILTMPQADFDIAQQELPEFGLTKIGNIVGRTGLWKRTGAKLQRLSPQGYMHTSTSESPDSKKPSNHTDQNT